MKRNSLFLKQIIMLSLLFGCMLMAADVTWTNSSGGNWNDAGNWDTGAVPGASDNVFVTLDGTYTITVDVDATVANLTLGASSGVQTLGLTSRTLTINGVMTVNANGLLDMLTTTLNGSGSLDLYGEMILKSTNTISVPVSNRASGILRVHGNTNTMSGAMSTEVGSLIDFNPVYASNAKLTFDNGFTNNGTIRHRNTSGYAWHTNLTVTSGNIINASGATIDIDGTAGNRTWDGGLTNQGLLDIDHALTLQGSGATSVNSGDIDVASGIVFSISGTGFDFDGGTMSGGGEAYFQSSATATFNTADLPAIRMRFLSSTLAAPAVVNSDSTLIFNSSNTISAAIHNRASGILRVHGNTNTMSGAMTTEAGSLIDFNPVYASNAKLTFDNGFTNNGTIRHRNTSGYAWHTNLTVTSGNIINASGATIDIDGTAGNRTWDGGLTNQGLLDIDHALTLQGSGATSVNSGDIDVASGIVFSISGTGFDFDGGTMSGGGEAYFQSSATATFNTADLPAIRMRFLSSTLAAPAVVNSDSTLIFNSSNTISAAIHNRASGILRVHGNTNTMSGAMSTEVGSLIDFNPVYASNAKLTFDNGFTNNGTIRHRNTSGYAWHTNLTVTSGNIINASGATIDIDGTAGNRTWDGGLTNQGLLDIDHALTLQGSGATSVNSGDIDVASGIVFSISGTGFDFDGGTMSGGGEAYFQSSATATFNTADLPAIRMRFLSSTLAAPAVVNSDSTLIFNSSNTISAAIHNRASGILRVHGNTNTMSGAMTTEAGSLIDFNPVYASNAKLTFDNGFTNNGTIRHRNTSGYAWHTNLTVTNGNIINASGATIDIDGTAGNRTWDGGLTNQGLLDIDHALTLQGSGATSVNSGDIDVASGIVFSISGTGFDFDGGTMSGGGEAYFQSSATATFNTADLPAIRMRFLSSTLAAPAVVNSDSTLIFNSSNTISAAIHNRASGILRVHGNTNTMSGAMTTEAGSLIDFNPVYASNAKLTFDNGFTNNGTIRHRNTSGYAWHTNLTVTSGNIINASGATIDIDGTAGNRTWDGGLTNQGLLDIDHALTLQGSGATSVNSGDIDVASGIVFSISGTGFDFDGGTMSGGGEAYFQSSATATFNTADLPAIRMRFLSSTLAAPAVVNSDSTLIFNSSNTISAAIHNRASGILRVHGNTNTMSGAMSTEVGSLIDFNPVYASNAKLTFDNGFTNNGTIRHRNTSGYAWHTNLTVTSGNIINASGATIDIDGTAGNRTWDGDLNNLGQITVDHPLTVIGTNFDNSAGGTLSGKANLNVLATGFTNAGTMEPGDSLAIFPITGDVTQTSTGALNVEIAGELAGSDYDQLNISNDVILDGALNINLLNGYQPAFGDSFVVINHAVRTDTFETVTGQDIGNGLWLNVKYRDDHVTLLAGNPPTVPVYTVTATAGANGAISPGGDVEVAEGDNQLFTMTPNPGFVVDDVLVDGISVGAVTTYEFVNVIADATIEVSFVPDTFTITATATANGSISPSGAVAVSGGSDQTFTILPDSGYHILNVTVDGDSIGPVSSYVFSSIDSNHSINASFEINTYAITATASGNGSITPSGVSNISFGGSILYTIAADVGNNLIDVLVDGVSVGAVTTYEFLDVNANHTITAVFAVQTFSITAVTGANGVVNPTGTSVVAYGSDLTYTITPNAGYTILDVLVDGISVGAVSSYDFTNITQNYTIEASFQQESYTITATAGANGSISPAGAISVNGGESQLFTITANAGYVISDVVVDDVSLGTVASYEFVNVGQNHTIDASFTTETFSIVAVAGANGSISPSGTVVLNNGNDQSYTISPNAGYLIGNVLVDGVSIGTPGSYDFLNVTANHVIEAYFTPEDFTYDEIATGVSNDLQGVSFIDELNGYAVGTGGVILYTDDGGTTWTSANHNVTSDLNSVQVIGGVAYALGDSGTVCVSYDGGVSWINIGPSIVTAFNGASFLNAYYGWGVGNGGSIYFYNGSIWTQQFIGGTVESFRSVYAIGGVAYAVGSGGIICKYVNGGWSVQLSGGGYTFNGSAFLNPSFGYAVGSGGTIYQTTDGGVTWIARNSGTTIDFYNCYVYNESVAYVVGDGGVVYQTIDGGITWTEIFFGGPYNFRSISFAGCRGYIVGQSGVAFSFDIAGCQNGVSTLYSKLLTGIGQRCTGVSFRDALSGCISGYGGNVLVTADGGATWTASNTGVANDLNCIQLVDSAAFIVGTDGLICRSDNDGVSWIPAVTNTTETFYWASFLTPGYGFAAGANGLICIYDGVNWTSQITGTSETFYGIYAVGGVAYAVGTNGIICKYTGSWGPLNSGTTITFYAVAFLDELFGYAVGADGTICRTRDGGLTWEPLNSGVTVDMKGCKIVSPRVAYCVGDSGVVLETTDCGETWNPVSLEFDIALEDLEVVDGQGFFIGDLGSAYQFSNANITDIPSFELSATDLDFGNVLLNSSVLGNVWVVNSGTATMNVLSVASDNPDFSATPTTAVVAAGDSAAFTVDWTAAVIGADSANLSFTHDASCDTVSFIVRGSGIEYALPGIIAGTVYADSIPLAGVTVTLLDTAGITIDSITPLITDANGYYCFLDVPVDSFQVSIVEPLGYSANENPVACEVLADSTTTVDFYLELVVCDNESRSAAYWRHQFSVYLCNWGTAKETEEDLHLFIDEVHEHYTPHFDFFENDTSFHQWRRNLRKGCWATQYQLAKREIAALVLNLVSLKVGQYTIVTDDGRTAGDVLTYASQLLGDGDPYNDYLAKKVAKRVNLRRTIGAGIIPAGSILYRNANGSIDWGFGEAPLSYQLHQNYPNPFNPVTTITYDLPEAGNVSILIFNLLGQRVAELVSDYRPAGSHQLRFDAAHLSSGVYLYVIQAGTFRKVRKMILLK